MYENPLNWIEEVHPEDRDRVEEAFHSLPDDEFDVEYRVVTDDGDVRWIHDRSEVVFTGDGEVHRIVGITEDVTESKERERMLREAKTRMEAAAEAGAIGTWEWRVPEDEMRGGASFAETFGVDPVELREGKPLDSFLSSIHEEDRARVEEAIEEALEECGDYREEYRVWDADGELRWVVARGHVECDEDGDPLKFPGVLVDITERKEREREAERQRRRYRTLVDNFPNGVVAVFDEDLRYKVVGGETPESVDAEPREMEGERVADVVPDDLHDVWLTNYRATFDGEERMFTAEVGESVVEVRTVPLRYGDGDVEVGLAISQEVTERRRRLREIVEQREKLDVINDVNAVVQRTSEEAIKRSDEDDVFDQVVEHLYESDYYGGAWIARRSEDPGNPGLVNVASEGSLTPRETSLGMEDPPVYVEPAVEAAISGRTCVQQGLNMDEAAEAEQVSAVSVPLRYQGESYGVLTVYSIRGSAFEEDEAEAVERLGTIIGHAVRSVHQQTELRRSERLYRKLAENVPNGCVSLVNEDLEVEILEGELLQKLDLEDVELKGEELWSSDSVTGDEADAMKAALEGALDGERRRFELEIQGRVLDVFTLPIWGEGAEEAAAIALAQDVTEEVERQRQLEHERERLELLVRLIRHNLLNSLNVVDARLKEVEGRVDFEVSSHLDTALERTDDMVNLVQTIRSLTDATVRDSDRELEAVDVDDVLAREVSSVTSTYPEADVSLESTASAEVLADELLAEAIENVLHNAVQHNDRENPTVDVEARETGEFVDITVEDDGPGVPSHIKDWFLDKGTQGFEEPGVGFGLHLVREIIESYGGTVSIADREPRGTMVRMRVPAAEDG